MYVINYKISRPFSKNFFEPPPPLVFLPPMHCDPGGEKVAEEHNAARPVMKGEERGRERQFDFPEQNSKNP